MIIISLFTQESQANVVRLEGLLASALTENSDLKESNTNLEKANSELDEWKSKRQEAIATHLQRKRQLDDELRSYKGKVVELEKALKEAQETEGQQDFREVRFFFACVCAWYNSFLGMCLS